LFIAFSLIVFVFKIFANFQDHVSPRIHQEVI